MSKRCWRWTLPVVVQLIVLTSGCSSNQAQEAKIMETTAREANKALVRAFSEAEDSRSYDTLDDIVAEDFVRHSKTTPGVEVASKEDLKAFFAANAASFSDYTTTIEMMVAEGDMVAVYATFAGTMDGVMNDIPATGRRVEMPIVAFFRIENGKILRVEKSLQS